MRAKLRAGFYKGKDLALGGSGTNGATVSSSDMRRIQTLFSLVVFVSDVDPPANTFMLASVVKASFEGFLGLTSGFAKNCSLYKIYLELPGLDITVLTKDVSLRYFKGSRGLGTVASSTDEIEVLLVTLVSWKMSM